MFDPVVGRFLEEDPSGFAPGDPDLFRYVENAPTNATDPSGLDRLDTEGNGHWAYWEIEKGWGTPNVKWHFGTVSGEFVDINFEGVTGRLPRSALERLIRAYNLKDRNNGLAEASAIRNALRDAISQYGGKAAPAASEGFRADGKMNSTTPLQRQEAELDDLIRREREERNRRAARPQGAGASVSAMTPADVERSEKFKAEQREAEKQARVLASYSQSVLQANPSSALADRGLAEWGHQQQMAEDLEAWNRLSSREQFALTMMKQAALFALCAPAPEWILLRANRGGFGTTALDRLGNPYSPAQLAAFKAAPKPDFVAPAARGAAPSLDPAHLRTLELHGFKPVDVLPGNNGKVAIIGRPMGGETIGKAGRPTGVHDYADALKKRGYEVEVYNPPERGELRRLVIEHLERQKIPVTEEAIQAARLPDEVIKTTKSYQNNVAWAKRMKDEGYTVIDIGNNSGSPLPGAYYEAELGILFPGRTK